jgi:hypothetical protein
MINKLIIDLRPMQKLPSGEEYKPNNEEVDERCDRRIARIPSRPAAIEEEETDASCGNTHRRDHGHDDRPLQIPLPIFITPACLPRYRCPAERRSILASRSFSPNFVWKEPRFSLAAR